MLTITNAGLAASANAALNGFKISITRFSVTEHDLSSSNNSDLLGATELFGTAVYTSEIKVVEVVGTSTVKLTLEIPKEIPRSGSWMLRELGIYLDTGELFAVGPLEPAYEKNNEYGIKVYAICQAQRLGEVVSVNLSQNHALPVIAKLSSLPPPIESENSVVAVLDESLCEYSGDFTSGLAVKSGPGLLHWAFPGYHRIYVGTIDTIVDQSTFKLPMVAGGFWLMDDEIIISQIIAGAGYGQVRKLKYNRDTEKGTVTDIPFQHVDATSIIALWRDTANQLPARKISLPDYMVLGHGLNSWQRVSNPVVDLYTFESSTMTGTLNNESQCGSTLFSPDDVSKTTFVWCNGKLMPENTYTFGWNLLTVYGMAFGTKVDVLIFKKVASAVGGVLASFEAKHEGDGQTTRFYMSIVPKSHEWIMVYVDDVFVHQADYDFESTSILFHMAPNEGALVRIVQIGVYDDTNGSSEITRTFRQIYPGDMMISLATLPETPAQVLLFIDGKEYQQRDYQIVNTGIQLLSPPTFPGGLSYVDLFLMLPTTQTNNPYPTSSVSGLDTGPVWIDPAGLEGPPNKLVPVTESIISDGATSAYRCARTLNRDYVLVFVDNQFVSQSDYSWSSDQYGGLVSLTNPVPAGRMIDIVAFTEVTIDEGYSINCTTFNVMSSTDTVYQLYSVSDPANVIVTVGGYYQHKRTYTIDTNSRIFFQGVMPNLNIEIWQFQTTPHVGFRTTLRYDTSSSLTSNSYPLTNLVERTENVLTFVGVLKYDNIQYGINAAGNRVSLSPNTANPVSLVSFTSGMPKTRLITRDEYNQSVVSFNYRNGTVLLTREDVMAVLQREDILSLLTDSERAILAGQGGGGTTEPPHALPGNEFTTSNWTVPAGVYHIRAVIMGAGGGGGGGGADVTYAGRGGKRGQVLVQELDVTPGQNLEVRLGVGGSSYLYTIDGTTIYPQPGDYGTSDTSRGYSGREGGNTIFHQWVALGGLGGESAPASAPTYSHVDSDGEGQVSMSLGSGAYSGGGAKGITGVTTSGNDVMMFSFPGNNGAFGYQITGSTGGGHNATSPGAGGGGAAGDPMGVGAFGGAGSNGVVYISWT